MKYILITLLIAANSFADKKPTAQRKISDVDACQASIINTYKLGKQKLSGTLLYQKILALDKNTNKEFITNATYEFADGGSSARVDFIYSEKAKLYQIQTSHKTSVSFPETTDDIESVVKKIPGSTALVFKASVYRLKEAKSLYVYQNGSDVTRVALGKEFSCEFTDFTSCMCAQ